MVTIARGSVGPGGPALPAASRSRARSGIVPLTRSLASWVAKLPSGAITVAAGRFTTLPAASMTSSRVPGSGFGPTDPIRIGRRVLVRLSPRIPVSLPGARPRLGTAAGAVVSITSVRMALRLALPATSEARTWTW